VRPILVGEAPARTKVGEPAFTSRSGEFLSSVAGFDVRDEFTCRNLLDYWPGPSSKGSLFPREEGREAAEKLIRAYAKRYPNKTLHFILAGRRVSGAFGVTKQTQLLDWLPFHLVTTLDEDIPHRWWVTVIPHPSLVNRFWNKLENHEAVKQFLNGRLPDAS
jgi:uracil-DNA glycosylase